ncbi:MAG TPA: EAL domain-containing protein [Burkholderiales bacterium]|nr:EAL domain-containing protein [Burkholderiales bacterium]
MVEDLHTDAELEIRELRRAGLSVEHRLVDREEDFLVRIADFAPDVIISDFSMPHFDGMAALALARERAPDVPFIFVSGTIGEEYAIRALKNGATDYVLKTNLVRLPAAIERALQERRERAARRRAESMFRDVLENAPDPMIVAEATGRITLVNGEVEKMFGYGRDELIGKPVELLLPAQLRDAHIGHRSEFLKDPKRRSMVSGRPLYALHRDGRQIPVEINLAPVGTPPNALVIATLRDLTERRAREERIARLGRMRDLLGAASSASMRIRERRSLFDEFCRIAVARGGFALARVVEVDGDGRLSIGASTDAGAGGYQRIIDEYNRDPKGAKSLLAIAIRSRLVTISNDVMNDVRIDEHNRLIQDDNFSLAILPVTVENALVAVVTLRAREPDYFDQEEVVLISEMVANLKFALELQAKQERLNYLALYDPLTELPNRTLFQDRLMQAIEASRRTSSLLALTVFDIERFKWINDAYGQSAGDQVLREAARRMREAVGDVNRVARLSGDLFAVMRPGIQDASEPARMLQERIDEVLGAPFMVDGREIKISAKAGIALFPDDGVDADTLFRNAEASLKRAKETGERYLFYAPHINARVAEQVDLENRLRRAVEQREIFLHFQPKVELESRRIVGLEALMRWLGPDDRLISPARFVPVLEETGLILDAGRHAIELATRTWREWQAAGLTPPRIAVNVSALQLRQKSFVEDVQAALGASDNGVDLEITESLLMQDIEASIRKLRTLREAGASIALDDFGTGHSSLAYLSRLPIDAVKIDRSFIREMTENADATSIVSTIISLAQALRLKVVAEGVESEDQARLLRLLRCDQMQGYLFSPPQASDKIEAMLRGTAA